ncbi:MAG: bifunctional folylpolyglutamate synthase/dihydrofolate synthase [Legionella sp.]
MTNVATYSVSAWLNYLENRHGVEIQLGLARIDELAIKLNLKEINATIITVGGTNGKGSTVGALEEIYSVAGYQVASYTSPHLLHFNERIRINKKAIDDRYLCEAFQWLHQYSESRSLTYFEMTTVAALWIFKQFKLDVIILEVGMGGRLDATNIIDADLSIVTTVDFDHQAYLGHTLEAIGYEKAGIYRCNKPAIYGDTNPPASLVRYARDLGSHFLSLGNDFSYVKDQDTITVFNEQMNNLVSLTQVTINPKAAVAAVIASYHLQKKLPVSPKQWQQALSHLSIPGRLQAIQYGSLNILLDVAHNSQAVNLLANYVASNQPDGKIFAIFSALKDKDLCGLLAPMKGVVDEWYPALVDSKRAASSEDLKRAFSSVLDQTIVVYERPADSFNQVRQTAGTFDLIIVYGSFLTVSAVMAELNIASRD